MNIDFKTQKGKFTFLKTESKDIPANKNEFAKLHLKECGFDVIGFADDLTEEQWSEVVDESENKNYNTDNYMWEDYTDIIGWRGFKTATESGKSLMESLEVYTENPLSKNRPIPKEDLDFKHDKIREFERLRMRWLKKQQRTGNWLLIKYT